MSNNILQRSLDLLLKRQTNILSAAFVIMATVIVSQILGLVRQRLLVAIFGASDTLGLYLASTRLPDFLFQIIIAGALSSAFIPVFSEYLDKGKEKEAYKIASTILSIGIVVFAIFSLILWLFAPFFLQLFNLGLGYSDAQMMDMANLMRIVILGQLLFMVGTFFSTLLQSFNHFFIPGIAAAFYNVGIILGIVILSSSVGIYAPAYGVVLGALFFILVQIPLVKDVGFVFRPSFSLATPGVSQVLTLMWPRTLSLAIFQSGTLATIALISFLSTPGRNYVIFDYAQTLAFAPVALFGQAIAQAAFPMLSRERERLDDFRVTFMTSFNQLLYLVLPVSAILLVLRIPVVRLIFGAGQFDWDATVLTGSTLSFFCLSLFAQALSYLVARGFYALHDTKTPLFVGTFTTVIMIALGSLFVLRYGHGVESIAIAYSIANILNLIISMVLLNRKIGGLFNWNLFFLPLCKLFIATIFTGIALWIPIKLLDQLVFDTTRTLNLLFLTGISSAVGLTFYIFLTWLFNVKEAGTFILLFKKLGNWREILGKSSETIDGTRLNP